MRVVLPLLLALLVIFGALPSRAVADHEKAKDEYAEEFQGYVAGASYLEGRIRAPCCWNQTLDIHGSEPANQLRREIRKRLKGGETVEQIEASIVSRYGERILAVPPGNPLKELAVFLTLGMVLAGAIAAFLLVRWRRRSGPGFAPGAPGAQKTGRDEWDDRLDKELERLER